MQTINTDTKTTLTRSLHSYYEALNKGDLQAQSALMTKESYIITLGALGFKRAFRMVEFKDLLKKIGSDEASLRTVETVLSNDLAKEAREHEIALVSFDSKGPDRITVRYTEDGYPKKVYFSSSLGEWKINYKAGRQKPEYYFKAAI